MNLPDLHELTPDTLPGSYQTAFGIVSVTYAGANSVKVRGYNPFTRRSFMMWDTGGGLFFRSTASGDPMWSEWEQVA